MHSAPLPSALQHKIPMLDEPTLLLPCLSPPGLILSIIIQMCFCIFYEKSSFQFFVSEIVPCTVNGVRKSVHVFISLALISLFSFSFWVGFRCIFHLSVETQLAKVARYFMVLDVTAIVSLHAALFHSDISRELSGLCFQFYLGGFSFAIHPLNRRPQSMSWAFLSIHLYRKHHFAQCSPTGNSTKPSIEEWIDRIPCYLYNEILISNHKE